MSVAKMVKSALLKPTDRGRGETERRASVVILLRGTEENLSLCLIRRSAWEGDPWSRHIALPGGRSEGDERPWDTARREVFEEIGLELTAKSAEIELPELGVSLAGRDRILQISPFVAYLGPTASPFRQGPEVEDVFWTPISHFWEVSRLHYLSLDSEGQRLLYPAVSIEQGTVFGITLRIISIFSDHLGHPLPFLEEIPGLRRELRE
jgi:8-oxo-dGTP pyrophosphatase MutT (NUDIX family)